MKRLIIFIAIASFTAMAAAQEVQVQKNPLGNWKVEAPYAPEGFQYSKLGVTKVEDKFVVEMNFEDVGYKLMGERVTFIDGVLKFGFWVEEVDVTITFKFNGEDKLEGSAVTVDGEIPMTAVRIKPQ
jgi:hypothetical protein